MGVRRLIFGCLFFLQVIVAFADGMFIRPIIDEETETTVAFIEEEKHQRAFLYYDAANEIERLVVEVQTGMFSGDFAWFIPVPPAYTTPDVQFEEITATSNVFTELERLTAPEVELRRVYYGAPPSSGCMLGCAVNLGSALGAGENEETQKPDVVVWESGETASFVFSHVSAPTVPALVSWCVDNGFGEPDDSVQVVLLDYVNRSWSFVLVQGAKDTETPNGGCVSLTFSPAVALVFPLTISAPGHLSPMPIDLYIVSDTYFEPATGTADFSAQAKVYPDPLRVEADFIMDEPDLWLYGSYAPYNSFFDEAAIPQAAELLDMVLVDQDLREQRENSEGSGSWWRFFSQVLTAEDLSNELYAPVNEYLGDVVPPAEFVFSRFYRWFEPDEELVDVFFTEDDFQDIPFAARLHITADVYDPDRDSSSAGIDLSLGLGLLIWAGAKTAMRMQRRRA